MAENLPKRQIAGDAKWLSTIARLNRRGGHGDISNEVAIGDDWKDAIAKLLWALSQLQRGCQNPILGLRAECWAPDPREAFIPIRPLQPGLEADELLQPNHTYYVHTAGGAITRWLPDATDSDGEVIEVKDVDGSAATNNITIKATKGQTLDGASSKTISQAYGSIQIRSNGRQWYSMSNDAVAGVTDHGALSGLADDDHPSYMLASGTVVDNTVAVYVGTGGRDLEDTPVTIDPANGNTAGIGTLASGAHTITQATVGTVFRTEVSTATNDDPTEKFYHGRGTTTEDGLVNLFSFTPAADKRYTIEATVNVRQTVGAGTGTGRTINIIADIQNIGGTVTVTIVSNTSGGTLAVNSCTVATGLGSVTLDCQVEGAAGSGKTYVHHAKIALFGPVGT